ncbi:ComEC family competence protein [Neorhizobium sp. BETTINA12A]|uniref:ComEC/Rec2 family competence protein n=1 Tax=Neorhizobium sp. BETTINA12A TaxID=2908924 RepID=UPI001FF499AA|nr:ComEC/Rec2 family competence protein [Neorhizobium sp. BETTINA12A]MCJ9750617.1 ComEC family competence protein [Neorhizobium sp. BETTINA12A]
MPEENAFPTHAKAGKLISRPPDPRINTSAPDSGKLRNLAELFPAIERRPPVHTLDGGFRRSASRRLDRLLRSFPIMLEEEMVYGHGFLFLPVVVGAGAVCWFALPYNPAFWPFFLVFCVCTIFVIVSRHRSGTIHLLPLGVALFLGGMMLAQFETWRRSTVVLDTPVTTELAGVVERREIDAQGRWRYVVLIDRTSNPEVRRPPERVSLLARSRHEPAQIGETISGRARLSPPSGPALPGLNDFAFSSYFDGIGAVGFFYGAPKKQAAGPSTRSWIADIESRLFDLRSAIATRIRETVPGDSGAFAAAIVTDERRAISKGTTEALRLSGLAHIVAISGLNMALAAGIFFVGVRTVLAVFMGFGHAYPVKKIAALGALIMVTAYYLISGFGVSAERAYIMMAIMLVAVLFDRPSISLHNVALSALVIIAMSPSEMLGPSFQMSFAATVALVAGYALWKQRAEGRDPQPLPFRHRMVMPILASWNFAAGVFVTSLIGGVSTAMFSVEHFHRIATYGLAANLAAMPIISFVVMPAGLVGMLLMPFGLDAPFMKLMGLGLEAVIAIAGHVAAWGGDVGIGRQHPWFLTVSTAGFLLLTLLRTKLRLIGPPLMVTALLLSWHERSTPLADILVSEDGTMVALVNGERVSTNRTRPPDFIYDQWKRALLLGDPTKPDMSPARDKPPDRKPAGAKNDKRRELTSAELETVRLRISQVTSDRFTCEPKAWCAASTGNAIIVAVEDGRYAGAACDAADLVIAPRARFDRCRSGGLMINGATLRKTGALEISLNGTGDMRRWEVRAAMAAEDRPWTRHRHYDWRSQSFDNALPEPLRQLISDNGG